jgi:hypothetical protein
MEIGATQVVSGGFFIVAAVFALALVALLLWSFGSTRQRRRGRDGLAVLDSAPQHLCNMGPIRRSQDPSDFDYAMERGGKELGKRLRRERRNVALLYLESLRSDFDQLLRIARVVALLSPEVSSSHEYERLRLSILFRVRFQLVKLRFLFGNAAMPELTSLGQMVTSLAIRMETAMATLGERAALAADLALQSDR